MSTPLHVGDRRAGLYFRIMVSPSAGHNKYEVSAELTKELGEHLVACDECRAMFVEQLRAMATRIDRIRLEDW
jgi:hypothetical protein